MSGSIPDVSIFYLSVYFWAPSDSCILARVGSFFGSRTVGLKNRQSTLFSVGIYTRSCLAFGSRPSTSSGVLREIHTYSNARCIDKNRTCDRLAAIMILVVELDFRLQ